MGINELERAEEGLIIVVEVVFVCTAVLGPSSMEVSVPEAMTTTDAARQTNTGKMCRATSQQWLMV